MEDYGAGVGCGGEEEQQDGEDEGEDREEGEREVSSLEHGKLRVVA